MKKQKLKKMGIKNESFVFSQPIAKQYQRSLIKKEPKIKKILKKILSNLAVFAGGYLTFISSLTILQILDKKLDASNITKVLTWYLIGTVFLSLGIGIFDNKRNSLLYFTIPIMGFALGLVFQALPLSWQSQLFGWLSVIFYQITLIIFYCLKEYVENSNPEKNLS